MKRMVLPLAVVALLAACSGNMNGGAENALPQASSPSPMVEEAPQSPLPSAAASPDASLGSQSTTTATPTPMATIYTSAGKITGLDNQFVPNDGDTSTGGNGGVVDGLGCSRTMYGTGSEYHVHVFLGLLVNGKEIAIPDAIGMYKPGTETNGITNTAYCYYAIHTHDAGGYIHIEANSTAPYSASLYTLGNVLDVWGEPISSTRFGPYTGTVTVFYATTPLRSVTSGTYVQYTGTAPKALKLSSHEAIWIQVGTVVPASRLPKIHFYSEY